MTTGDGGGNQVVLEITGRVVGPGVGRSFLARNHLLSYPLGHEESIKGIVCLLWKYLLWF